MKCVLLPTGGPCHGLRFIDRWRGWPWHRRCPRQPFRARRARATSSGLDHLRALCEQDQRLSAYAEAHGLSPGSLYRAQARLRRRGLVSESRPKGGDCAVRRKHTPKEEPGIRDDRARGRTGRRVAGADGRDAVAGPAHVRCERIGLGGRTSGLGPRNSGDSEDGGGERRPFGAAGARAAAYRRFAPSSDWRLFGIEVAHAFLHHDPHLPGSGGCDFFCATSGRSSTGNSTPPRHSRGRRLLSDEELARLHREVAWGAQALLEFADLVDSPRPAKGRVQYRNYLYFEATSALREATVGMLNGSPRAATVQRAHLCRVVILRHER